MACVYMHPVKRNLTNGMAGNPPKKIKLELNYKADGSLDKDDLWGADDLTADEFDLLEIQATQSCNQTVSSPSLKPLPVNSSSVELNNVSRVDDLKQLQYELEGRLKLLTHSLEKSTKELNEERLNREKMISDKMKAFLQRENELHKNIEKLQSILEFKEQEMKSIDSKLNFLKAQNQDQKNISSEKLFNKDLEDIFASSKCSRLLKENTINQATSNKFSRKHKLVVDSSRGELERVDFLSTMLCNRLSIPTISFSEKEPSSSSIKSSFDASNSSPLCIIQLKFQKKSFELLEYCKSCLKQSVLDIRSEASKNNVDSLTKSPTSSLNRRDKTSSVQIVMACARDAMNMLLIQKFDSFLMNSSTYHPMLPSYHKMYPEQSKNTMVISSSSSESSKSEKIMNFETAEITNLVSEILESLLILADPKTFPAEYPKYDLTELALFVLLNFSLELPIIFLKCVPVIPIHILLSPDHSVASISTALKFLTSLTACQAFPSHLVHKDSMSGGCIMCNIAEFMSNPLLVSPEKYAPCMLRILDFFSSVMSVQSTTSYMSSVNRCLSEVTKSIIRLLWKYYQLKEKNTCAMLIIKRGLLLLHVMSLSVPDFKEKRLPVEDDYISLVSNFLTISKENTDFREHYDLIHNLWDFQTDTSEFDLDEGSDELQYSTNDIETTDSS